MVVCKGEESESRILRKYTLCYYEMVLCYDNRKVVMIAGVVVVVVMGECLQEPQIQQNESMSKKKILG